MIKLVEVVANLLRWVLASSNRVLGLSWLVLVGTAAWVVVTRIG